RPGRSGLRVRTDVEHFGAELVAHEYVTVEVDIVGIGAQRGHALHLPAELEHGRPVLGEMEVGAADPARLDFDQYLSERGLGVGHVVTDVELALAQRHGPHVVVAFCCFSSTCDWMAFIMAWPAGAKISLRLTVAHSCDSVDAPS